MFGCQFVNAIDIGWKRWMRLIHGQVLWATIELAGTCKDDLGFRILFSATLKK